MIPLYMDIQISGDHAFEYGTILVVSQKGRIIMVKNFTKTSWTVMDQIDKA